MFVYAFYLPYYRILHLLTAVYKKGARPSHFRGVHDITLITKMVWKSLHTRRFFLSGLYHSSIRPCDVTKLKIKK